MAPGAQTPQEERFQCWQIWQPVDWSTEGPQWAHVAAERGQLKHDSVFKGLLSVLTADGWVALHAGDWLVWSASTGELAVCPDSVLAKQYVRTGRTIPSLYEQTARPRSVLEY